MKILKEKLVRQSSISKKLLLKKKKLKNFTTPRVASTLSVNLSRIILRRDSESKLRKMKLVFNTKYS